MITVLRVLYIAMQMSVMTLSNKQEELWDEKLSCKRVWVTNLSSKTNSSFHLCVKSFEELLKKAIIAKNSKCLQNYFRMLFSYVGFSGGWLHDEKTKI